MAGAAGESSRERNGNAPEHTALTLAQQHFLLKSYQIFSFRLFNNTASHTQMKARERVVLGLRFEV